jgi:hypothetical protein
VEQVAVVAVVVHQPTEQAAQQILAVAVVVVDILRKMKAEVAALAVAVFLRFVTRKHRLTNGTLGRN